MKVDLKSLQQRHREWIDIVNKGDTEAYPQLLTKDAVWFPPGGDPIVGRKAFREWVAPFFNRFTYDFDIRDERITAVEGRAVEKAVFTSEMTPKEGGKTLEHSGTFIALWLCDKSGIWRIERYIDDTDM